ncbi:MAG: hypothetical protein HC880_20945 [Bacteroidia bacterium]|nr:hypothetical protein [Bacteroidia bacterium]
MHDGDLPLAVNFNATVDCDNGPCIDEFCPFEPCNPTPSPPTTQPGANPVGRIRVNDTQLGDEGLRRARIVAKRWFKIERTYTDNNGNFNINKRFRNKVKLRIKFKNEDALVRGVRRARLWQMFRTIAFTIGPFRGSQINTVSHTFQRTGADDRTRGNRYWVGATVHNAIQHFRALTANQGTGSLPHQKLRCFISNWGFIGSASAPLFAVRSSLRLDNEFIHRFLIRDVTTVLNVLLPVFVDMMKKQVDIALSYRANNLNDLNSDNITGTMFHELAHATFYRQCGHTWYTEFVDAVIWDGLFAGPALWPR